MTRGQGASLFVYLSLYEGFGSPRPNPVRMTTFVSSRYLPGIEFHPLATLLDRLSHLASGFAVQCAGKAKEITPGSALGQWGGKTVHHFRGPLLQLRGELVQIIENLLSDRRENHCASSLALS